MSVDLLLELLGVLLGFHRVAGDLLKFLLDLRLENIGRQFEFPGHVGELLVDSVKHLVVVLRRVLLLHRLAEHVAELLDRLDPCLFGELFIVELVPALDAEHFDGVLDRLARQRRFAVIGGIGRFKGVLPILFRSGQRGDASRNRLRFAQPEEGVLRFQLPLHRRGGILRSGEVALVVHLEHILGLSGAFHLGVVAVSGPVEFDPFLDLFVGDSVDRNLHLDALVIADFEFGSHVGADGEFELFVEFQLRLAFDAAGHDVVRLVLPGEFERGIDQFALQFILQFVLELAADQPDRRFARTKPGQGNLGRDFAQRVRGFSLHHIRRNSKVKLLAARLRRAHFHLDGIDQFIRHLKHQTFP